MSTTPQQFFETIRAGDLTKVEQMLNADSALLKARDDQGLDPYTVARYSRQDTIAQMLLDRGIELDVFGAILAGNEGRVRELIHSDPSLVKSYSRDGWTPLHLSAFFGCGPCADDLIAQGADVNAVSQNEMKNTPLHAAAAGRNRGIAAELIAAGARVDSRQHGGWTALHSAAQNGDVEFVKLLLSNGADLNAKADNNQTAMDLALSHGQQEVVDVLEAYTPRQVQPAPDINLK